ncbi:DUF6461 domain-containing protein [Herbidospora cretacea]|uniref:DUF6461 domain-containing protein n=1 Tax=Herbidospora cretacea TaxID=28444 RepID=UPI0004C2B5E2|nr:DUF6461 domain-containing protein [Herbidospora cretacea]
MAEPHDEFAWVAEFGPLSQVSSVSFVRTLSPAEALTRLGARSIEPATFEQVEEGAMTALDLDYTSYAGALQKDGWTIVIELWSTAIPVHPPLLHRLSQGTEVVSINRNVHASDYFSHSSDGDLATWFDLLGPDVRMGTAPDRLADLMRDVGLDPDLDRYADEDEDEEYLDDPYIGTEFPRAFALAKRITGFPFTRDLLDGPLVGAQFSWS